MSKDAALERKTTYRVFVNYGLQGPGGMTDCKTLAEAESQVEKLKRLGFERNDQHIEVWKISHTRLR